MKHSEFHLKSYDGLDLYCQSWISEKKPKAIINLVHEHGEHSSRYQELVKILTKNNYAVMSTDLRGHGRTVGKRGYTSTYRKLIKDLKTMIEKSESLHSGIPQILLGTGLGGNISIYYLSNNITNISGLIVAAPWLSIEHNFTKGKLIAGNILRYLIPGLIIETGFSPEDKLKSPEAIKKYKKDPLIHDKISIKLFCEVIFAGQRSARSIYKINMPILVMHGDKDKIASLKASKNFILNASVKTAFKVWEGYSHDLLNDEGSEQVCEYIVNWLDTLIEES
jgi:acylglycerol lipase